MLALNTVSGGGADTEAGAVPDADGLGNAAHAARVTG